MSMLASQYRALWVVFALAIQPACTAEPHDAQDGDTDGEVTGAGETLDVWSTSGTDEAGASSESGEESGGGSGEDPWPPPEEPDDSCLENLPAPDSQDKVWIAAGHGGTILRSTDAVHWDPIEIGGMKPGGFVSARVGSTVVLAAWYGGGGGWPPVDELFVSDDGGLTWELLASGLPTGLHGVEGVGDLFLARDQAGATSYWSADGKTWQEAQGVAPTVYAVGPAGILSGLGSSLDVTLSVDGKVWSELLPTMGLLGGDYLGLAGRGDQYLAWPYEFPPNRIHSSVDGLTWTTSDIAVGMPPDSVFAYTDQVRWNGAQYVLYGSWVGPLEGGLTDANYMIARSCNGRVWHYTTLCSSSDPPNQVICQLSFASTAAMTVVVVSIAGFSDALLEGYVDTHIRYSADLVTWESAGSWDYLLTTLVVGDP
jgi:hypothetical protein